LHPEDNNERQSIHEHVSVPLTDFKMNHAGTAASAVQPGKARPASTTISAGASR
jgi:hypothetical protein